MASGPASRTRTRLGREERREQLIAAAARVFSDRDPSTVAFEEIAEAAGVSRALVYNYFGDRDGLVEAVHLRHVEELRSRVSHALSSVRDRREALRRVVRVHLEYARDDPMGYRYAVGATTSGEHALDQGQVAAIAAAWGGGPEANLIGRGTNAAIRSMTLHWLRVGVPDIQRAEDVILQLLWSGVSGMAELGLPLRQWWEVPPSG
jgi:AcrR family transcriptional regulator